MCIRDRSYGGKESYVLGAPEFILGAEGYAPYRSVAEEAMADGSRVLLDVYKRQHPHHARSAQGACRGED